MPSTFPPPSVERHHSRRRSGRQGEAGEDLERGNYSDRPVSSHYNDGSAQQNPTYQPQPGYPTGQPQDPYDQAAARGPINSGNHADNIDQSYNNTVQAHNDQQASRAPYHAGTTTADPSTYQPPSNNTTNPTHHHAPHHGTYNHPPTSDHSPVRSKLPFLSSRRRARPDTTANQSNEPSPLAPKSRGGNWETIRGHLVAMSGEFIGTILFLWFALSAAQVAAMTNSEPGGAQTPQTLLFISLAFGFSLAVNAWAFYRISGGLFNPAVVLGMCVSGNLPWIRGAFLLPAQILGGIIAAALVQAMFPGDVKAVTTMLNTGVSVTQGLFIEMFLTALLVFTILMLAAEKHQATFIAPVGIGLSLFVAELTGVYFTGGSLNPARSFGPAVVARSFPGHHWIYWLGPVFGALLAAGYYKLVKYLNYEEANPGQDAKHE